MRTDAIVLDTEAMLGGDTLQIVDSRAWNEVDRATGKITEVKGAKFTALVPKLGFEKITIKVPGVAPVEISPGKIQKMKFDGLHLSMYVIQNQVYVVGEADACQGVEK